MENKKINVFKSTLELLPGMWPTPLVRLKSLSNNKVDVWAKLEFFNPFSHSIKDRPVWNMIMRKLKTCVDCGRLYEATSGNVGISMACISNALGIFFRAYLPKPTPKLTKVILKILGAEIVETSYETISHDMINMVMNISKQEKAINLNQFVNDANFEVHYLHTAKEIDEQLLSVNLSPPKAIIAGIGTSGHISAISKYFKGKYGRDVKVIGVIPKRGESIPGIKRTETRPKWFFMVEIDNVIEVSRQEAIEETIYIARNEGLLVGLSSGAVTKAFKLIKNELGSGVYVLIYPDDLFKYIEALEEYLREKGEL